MEYQVSARKYRPMTFASVVGQSALTTTLKNAIQSGKLAHAFLFCGPRGVGKTTCARIFAKTINCTSLSANGEACGECESCKAFAEGRSMNVFELDAASNNGVEHIKTLMEQTRIPPQVGKYKVFIIDEAHMLSQAAFNAFLKTLEEPPAYVIFILATTEKHKLLPTILSRCQIYDFDRMNVPNTVNHLKMVAEKEGYTYEEEALEIIAEKADGGMRDALSIFDQAASFCQGNITVDKVINDLNLMDIDNYFKFVDMALENKCSEMMLLLNNMISNGIEASNIANGFASHIRNLLMARDEKTVDLLEVSQRYHQRYIEQAKKCSPVFLFKALQILNRCDLGYRESSNKRLLVELSFIEVGQITQPADDPSASPLRGKMLKTLFSKIMKKALEAAPQVAVTPSASPKDTTTSEVGNSGVFAPVTAATSPAAMTDSTAGNMANTPTPSSPSTSSTPVSLTPSIPSPEANTATPSQPRIKLKNLGNTFSNLLAEANKTETVYVPEVENKGENNSFTDDDVRFQWLSMCNRMKAPYVALASSMKLLLPTITEFPNLELVVTNSILLEQISEIRKRIEVTLAKGLHNAQVTLKLRLAKTAEIKPVLSKRELLLKAAKDNPMIKKMVQGLDLELM